MIWISLGRRSFSMLGRCWEPLYIGSFRNLLWWTLLSIMFETRPWGVVVLWVCDVTILCPWLCNALPLLGTLEETYALKLVGPLFSADCTFSCGILNIDKFLLALPLLFDLADPSPTLGRSTLNNESATYSPADASVGLDCCERSEKGGAIWETYVFGVSSYCITLIEDPRLLAKLNCPVWIDLCDYRLSIELIEWRYRLFITFNLNLSVS